MNYVARLYRLLGRTAVQARVPVDPSEIEGPVFVHWPPNCVAPALPNAKISWNPSVKHSAVCVWGHSGRDEICLRIAQAQNCPVILCEDGFVRSLDTWCNRRVPARDRLSVAVTMDPWGYYFDATRRNRLTGMLDGDGELTPEQQAEARALRRLLVEERISKYNHQPLVLEETPGRPGAPKVLVVDQSCGDFSILRGGATDGTFMDMLADACAENPDCDILVKTHPDATAPGTSRTGYFQGMKPHGHVYPVTRPCNPYALMELVDKVYVVTSQFGLEALLAGKETHVYGKPFYAGWGLTKDRQSFGSARSRTRTLDDLVHFTYLRYMHWNDPDTGRACSAREGIDWIRRNRKEHMG